MDIHSLSDEERDLLAKYRLCDAQNRHEIQLLIKALNRQKTENENKYIRLFHYKNMQNTALRIVFRSTFE